MSKGEDTS